MFALAKAGLAKGVQSLLSSGGGQRALCVWPPKAALVDVKMPV